MLETYYTSNKIISGFSSITFMNFVRAWDAMFLMKGYDLYKVFRDGTTIRIGGTTSNTAYVAMAGGFIAYWTYFDGRPIRTCQFLAQPIYTSPISNYAFSMSKMYTGDYIDEERKLVIHRNGGGQYAKVYDLVTGAFIKDITVAQGNSTYSYHYAGNGRICAVGMNGNVAIYDYISDVICQKSTLGISIRCGVYDCNFNLIIALDTTGHIQIFGLDDSGDTLATPTFSPTGNKYLYSGYRLTTRLTGPASSPIPYKVIHWELIGTKGTLEKPFSITDENGYAYNYYWCPTDSSQIGSETVKVWCEH